MDEFITLEHGNGGSRTAGLISELILPAFGNETLNELSDGAVIDISSGKEKYGNIVFSTDSFVIDPLFFPGGDIGKLAVCGTVNDISVSGGIPEYLSLGAIIEEGFPVSELKKIICSVKEASNKAGVKIVTGDTKVVERGKCDGIYLNTSGIGRTAHSGLSIKNIKAGDKVIVSGPVGEHGISVMLARNPGLLQSGILSDCAPVNEICKGLFSLKDDLKVMRDPTRGGLATVLCEFVEDGADDEKAFSIEIEEASVPVEKDVQAACDILGLDPLYLACEGRIVAIVSPDAAENALSLMQKAEDGIRARIIGTITDDMPGKVILKTAIGGSRILSRATGDQLPRIC